MLTREEFRRVVEYVDDLLLGGELTDQAKVLIQHDAEQREIIVRQAEQIEALDKQYREKVYTRNQQRGISTPCSEYHVRCVRCLWPVERSFVNPNSICLKCTAATSKKEL